SRYASSRLPGKPLLDICGKPMIQRVVENANRSGADFVWVATDDERIQQVVNDFGGEAILTSPLHSTGTDRLAEVVAKKTVPDSTIIVNVQGDEPLLAPHFVQLVAQLLQQDEEAGLATLAAPISEVKDLFNPNIVKVVLGRSGQARLFSRAPIPWDRDACAAGQPANLPV